jgi:hypothetical protein
MVIVLGIASTGWTSALFASQTGVPLWFASVLTGLVAVVAFAMTSGRYRLSLRVSLLALFLAVGYLTIEVDPGEDIDVFVFQQLGSRYLLDGVNPYSAQYPNIYSQAQAEKFYGEGLANEHLEFGFPYLPMSLFMAVPGYIFGGDYRYSLLTSAGILLWMLTNPANGRAGRLSGALYAVFPLHSGFGGMFGEGWTEPFVVLLLALVTLLIVLRNSWIPPVFGLFLASKLTLVVVAPLYMLIDRSVFQKVGQKARLATLLLSGALVTLPLAIMDWSRFWFSVVVLQFLQPIRSDSLSLSVWLDNWFGPLPPMAFNVLPFVSASIAMLLVFRHPDRSAAGFALACGFVSLAWLVLTKQSFLNHYYFAFAALLLGLGFSERANRRFTPTTQAGGGAVTEAPRTAH